MLVLLHGVGLWQVLLCWCKLTLRKKWNCAKDVKLIASSLVELCWVVDICWWCLLVFSFSLCKLWSEPLQNSFMMYHASSSNCRWRCLLSSDNAAFAQLSLFIGCVLWVWGWACMIEGKVALEAVTNQLWTFAILLRLRVRETDREGWGELVLGSLQEEKRREQDWCGHADSHRRTHTHTFTHTLTVTHTQSQFGSFNVPSITYINVTRERERDWLAEKEKEWVSCCILTSHQLSRITSGQERAVLCCLFGSVHF